MLTPFGERIWTLDGDRVRMFGIPFSTRMTVVQLQGGGLWLHSPVAPTPERLAAVNALGQVAHIVAPNRFHSMGLAPWKQAYPGATTWASPKFLDRHPGLPVDQILGEPAPWDAELAQVLFGGKASFLDEVIFFHRPSSTLIVTDVIQRHDPEMETWFWSKVKGSVGILGEQGGVARDLRMMLRDKQAVAESVKQILSWPLERMIISHGMCAQSEARLLFERAFEWLD